MLDICGSTDLRAYEYTGVYIFSRICLMPGCDIFAFSLKSLLSELSRGPLYLPRFWSPDAHTRTQEARCTGARFAPGRGRGRGVCRSRPANTQLTIRDPNVFDLFPSIYTQPR